MARHKDISRAHALLEGEGWHIVNVGSQRRTNRKNKRRCVHYNKTLKTCKISSFCVGSSNCGKYREW